MKQGWTIDDETAGLRLDRFLASAERLGSRSRVVAAIDRGRVFVNDREAARADAGTVLRRGDVVHLWMDRPGSAKRRRAVVRAGDLRIVYEDKTLLVVDKPAGVLSVPLARSRRAGSAYDQLADHLGPRGHRRPLVVHRIDRDTSGLVVFAKQARAQAALKDQFQRREPERVYLAIVSGHPQPSQGTWRDTLAWDQAALVQKPARAGETHAREAICHYRVVERLRHAALLEVRLVTGKRNQIRLQAQLRGHPLIGERQYAAAVTPSVRFERQALHAHRLGFQHPVDGRALSFASPLPPDMAALLTRLRA